VKSSGIAVLAVVLLIAGAFTLVLTQAPSGGGIKQAEAQCMPSPGHDCLPELGVIDTTGLAWTNEALAGKVVVVNFWATWCNPCVHEIPLLSAAHDRYKDDVVMLGVVTDEVGDAQLARFIEQHGLTYPVVRADPDLYQSFGFPDALPTTFFYDRHGALVRRYVGPLSQKHLDAWLPPLLERN